MPNTIEQAKQAILKHSGKASKHQIARELKISLDYASLVLGELKRKGEVVFADGFYALTSAKRGVTQDEGRKKSATPTKRLKKVKKAKKAEKRAPHPLISILGISDSLVRTLEKAGYDTIKSLADAPINKLMAEAKLKLHSAAQLINQARKTK